MPKDRVTRTTQKTGCKLRLSGRVNSSCSTSVTRYVNLVTNPLISHEGGKDWEVFTKMFFSVEYMILAIDQRSISLY